MLEQVVPGVLATALIWLVLRTAFRARIMFSEQICVDESPHAPTHEKMRYRVKAKNVSLFRSIADIQFDAAIVARGLNRRGPKLALFMDLEISSSTISTLRPGQHRMLALSVPDLSPYVQVRLMDLGHAQLAQGAPWDLRSRLKAIADAAGVDVNGKRGPIVRLNARVTESWTGRQFSFTTEYKERDLVIGRFRNDITPLRRAAAWLRMHGRVAINRLRKLQYRFHMSLTVEPHRGVRHEDDD